MNSKLIVFNFGISDKVEVFVIEHASIIYAGEFHGTKFEDILKELIYHKNNSVCYLPKIAYLNQLSGKSCAQILIELGFKVA